MVVVVMVVLMVMVAGYCGGDGGVMVVDVGWTCSDGIIHLCRFVFGGVAPGVYKLLASHPVWSVRKVWRGGAMGSVCYWDYGVGEGM